jgi:pimeloyl-ACP methyl ester carboxylesterase/ribosomal protein S18 acetylase RimI-like enzyme
MRVRHVKANEVSLHCEAVGDPSDPAVLLIMGAMSSGVWWPEELCRRLAGCGRYVIRYDHSDTGKSTSYAPGEASYTVEDLADDAVAVLDGYGLDRAHLAGMSLGGYLAQLVALKYPSRALTLTLIASERLALADPDLPSIDPSIIDYHAGAARLDWSDRDAVVSYQVGAWRINSGSAHAFDEQAIRAMAEADFDRTPNLLTTFNHAALGDAIGWVDRLDEIDVPALVVHGTEDPVLPYAHALALAAALPKASLLTLEGTGHELHRADWPAILDAVEQHTAPRLRGPQSLQAKAPPTASARSSSAPGAEAAVTEGDGGVGDELGSILVRDLRPQETPEAVAVLARGMRDNPLHVAAYGEDPERRLRCHARLMRALLRTFSAQQPICAIRGGRLVGVTGVAPDGTCQATPMQRLRLLPSLVALGPRTAARVGSWISGWAKHDPHEAHVHLGPLAVDAHLQGQGIGSLIVQEHCRRLDRAREVGYLETDKRENVRFYERFGFEVIAEEPVIGVPNWFMRREPRPPGS